ncbi:MAG TPA: PfkB family carbohydrate kinase [Acidimicrobiales bacterium]|nr:PfkB family carbohydrate kinase [Acidimicrobiales bacterium]
MIASCGEAVLDLLPSGARALGGSPFNVALGVARLGGESAFLGALPEGEQAAPFLEALVSAGVSLAHLQRVPWPLLTAEVRVHDGVTDYRFSPDDSADRHLAPSGLAGVAALHVGSLVLARSPAAEAVARAATAFPGFLSLDPNARPFAIGDLPAWRSRLRRVAARADLVKLSGEDAAALAPGEAPAALAAALLASGCGAVVLTDGARGARLHLRSGDLAVPAYPAAPGGDAVGAGDSFMAGLLVALGDAGLLLAGSLGGLAPGELAGALRFAAAAASLTCAARGAAAPGRAAVEERLGRA